MIVFKTIVDYIFNISWRKTHINHQLILSDNSRELLLDIVLGTSLQFAQSKINLGIKDKFRQKNMKQTFPGIAITAFNSKSLAEKRFSAEN